MKSYLSAFLALLLIPILVSCFEMKLTPTEPPKHNPYLDPRYIGDIGYGFDNNYMIYHVTKDSRGEYHGLAISLESQLSSSVWSNRAYDLVGTNAQSIWDGYSNTEAIINQRNHLNSAAKKSHYYLDLAYGRFYYLPSIQELHLLYNNIYPLTQSCIKQNRSLPPINKWIWSSTEVNDSMAFAMDFTTGKVLTLNKNRSLQYWPIASF